MEVFRREFNEACRRGKREFARHYHLLFFADGFEDARDTLARLSTVPGVAVKWPGSECGCKTKEGRWHLHCIISVEGAIYQKCPTRNAARLLTRALGDEWKARRPRLQAIINSNHLLNVVLYLRMPAAASCGGRHEWDEDCWPKIEAKDRRLRKYLLLDEDNHWIYGEQEAYSLRDDVASEEDDRRADALLADMFAVWINK